MDESGDDPWEEIAGQDPDWVVLSLPRGKHGAWDEATLAATGERAAADLLAVARSAVGDLGTRLAVDVGCGVGRLTGALARDFDRVVGIDVTPTMLAEARRRVTVAQVSFVRADIAVTAPATAMGADVVVSERVLQHLGDDAVGPHLRALVGLLAPGGVAILQVPVALPRRVGMQPRRRAWQVLRRLGMSPRTLYWRLGLHPMSMRVVSPERIAASVGDGADLLAVDRRHEPAFGVTEAIVVLQRRDD